MLRVVIVLNWLGGAAILALLLATIIAEQWTFTALGIPPSSVTPSMIMGVRAIAVLGLVAVPLNDVVLRRLRAIVETVRSGDPFIATNADRLKDRLGAARSPAPPASSSAGSAGNFDAHHPLHLDAGFSTSGWLATLLTFILARVFAAGTLIREDLKGTV
jgi:hypothetical protein